MVLKCVTAHCCNDNYIVTCWHRAPHVCFSTAITCYHVWSKHSPLQNADRRQRCRCDQRCVFIQHNRRSASTVVTLVLVTFSPLPFTPNLMPHSALRNNTFLHTLSILAASPSIGALTPYRPWNTFVNATAGLCVSSMLRSTRSQSGPHFKV